MYHVFEKLLKEYGVKASEVSKATGIPQSTFSDWKKGKSNPKDEKISKIANFFKVDKNIFSENKFSYCLECGNNFHELGESQDYHEIEHAKWKAAVRVFGFCWPRLVSENAKAIARTDLIKGELDFDGEINANIDIFKALFSRSVIANGYDLNHVDFSTYVSMLLRQDQFKEKIRPIIYDALVKQYGTSDGIKEGETYYYVNKNMYPDLLAESAPYYETVAAHKEDNTNWTKEELRKIEDYKQLLLAARKNKK
jgi:transcriptional regulator with XRE-family HTH domain